MIHLLWAIVNIGLFVFFIGICFSATKLVKERYGFLTSVVFVVGLLSFIGRSDSDKDNKEPTINLMKNSEFYSADSLDLVPNGIVKIDFKKTLISKYSLFISYSKDKQLLTNIPVSAQAFMNGFIAGTTWKTLTISVDRTNNNQKFAYHINGSITWSLLGVTVLSQYKTWEGIATLK